MAKVSIIANFYKSEKYIPRLLKSIARQTFTDWQLICVDDCSPGKDSEVIIKWTKKFGIQDKIILIRNKENLGISKAKEVGINYVRENGNSDDYTTFIDGDDFFEPDALEQLINAAEKNKTDVVISSSYRTYKLGPFYKKFPFTMGVNKEDYDRTLEKDELIDKFLLNFMGCSQYELPYWAKLYSNSFLKRLQFEFPSKENSAYEDFYFSMAVLLQCNSLCFINNHIYNWVWGGISTAKSHDDNWSVLKIGNSKLNSYLSRKAIIDKYGCEKSRFSLMAELKNSALDAWSSIAVAKPNSPKAKESKKIITNLLNHPAFDDLRPSYPPKLARTPLQKEFIDAIVRKDTETAYNCCHRFWRQNHNPWNYKYLIHCFLRQLLCLRFLS